jgi:hypothetical protein
MLDSLSSIKQNISSVPWLELKQPKLVLKNNSLNKYCRQHDRPGDAAVSKESKMPAFMMFITAKSC